MRAYLNSGLFISAILLFFLPFLEVRCGDGSRFAKMNGFDMAFARGIQFETEETEVYFAENPQLMQKMKEQNRPDLFSLGALLVLVTGLVIQFIPGVKKAVFSALLAGTGILILSAMMFMVNYIWEQQVGAAMTNPFFKKMFVVSLAYGYGIWLVIGACALIIVLNLLFMLNDRKANYLQVYEPEPELH